ncbi:single-stranded-DNA-specific exonuclease RecJ [Macrococcus equipercicus]|uniref:Single-stranded-DNA-specific exonuclease RecJ n=1 Tax=Macrococcus equipercicus TaxID=69967 RepID=A0A9Q9BPH3_9STAP|nr:single-stranded-DNA-specific exonuclease RecJ [Macrococcus equipercicus]UTH13054.1 single-stranded-DNA-specific exonuclease RecJ [Macrococcus equipercicus]
MTVNKQWVTGSSEELLPSLVEEFKISPLVQKVLAARGLTERSEIAALLTDQKTHDPFLMYDMAKAVDRIHEAVSNDEPILVYGDYDADGVTSVTVLMYALEQLEAMADFYIPNRFTEGYGPNETAFKEAADDGVGLIITVDNGIKGQHEVTVAKSLGVDVIITDHHEIGDALPDAYAVIHPAHPDGHYPCPHLAGVGVAYKLAAALLGQDIPEMLGLTAVGTVSDLVPLTDENRTLVKLGLRELNQRPPVGIKALLQQAGHKGLVTEETIGFMIGPRLNAVGRLDDARPAADLLMEQDMTSAVFLAEQVEQLNVERKSIVETIVEQAAAAAEDKVARGFNFLVIAGEDWNEGVLGIVASKLMDRYYLPVIVLNINREAGYAKGSARSIPQLSMYDYLDQEIELLTKFGGHHMAAGLTLPLDNVSELESRLNDRLDRYLAEHELQPAIIIDADVTLDELTVDHIYELDRLRPFGTANPQPIFSITGSTITQIKAIGQQANHLKMTLNGRLNVLKWSAGELVRKFPEGTTVDVCGRLQLNEWNNHVSPQLMMEDMKSDQILMVDFRNQHPRTFAFLKDEPVIYVINRNRRKNSDHYYFYGDNIAGHDKIVLRDLPDNLDLFQQTMRSSTASQMYIIFHEAKQVYFEGMPSLQQFRELYKLMVNRPVVLSQHGMTLTARLNVTPNVLLFMLAVLTELGVVSVTGETYQLDLTAGKVDIPSAVCYQQREQQLKMEQQLLFASFDSIKQLILDNMN